MVIPAFINVIPYAYRLDREGIIAVNYHARKFGITRFHKLKDAKERCPELMIIHVATYKEGAVEPGYWDNVDSRTHKVRSRRVLPNDASDVQKGRCPWITIGARAKKS